MTGLNLGPLPDSGGLDLPRRTRLPFDWRGTAQRHFGDSLDPLIELDLLITLVAVVLTAAARAACLGKLFAFGEVHSLAFGGCCGPLLLIFQVDGHVQTLDVLHLQRVGPGADV